MWIIDCIRKGLQIIEWLIKDTEKKLEKYQDLPDKTLVSLIKGRRHNIYYYEQERIDNKQVRRLIGTINTPKVIHYKERRFYQDTLKVLYFDKELLKEIVEKFRDYSPAAIHRQLPSSYKNLPDECYVDDRFEELKEWAAEQYKRNPYPLPTDPNVARDGTPMRSKGECMWYDNILFEKIPVRIEPELILTGKSGKTYKFYPDFVFMCYDGSLIIVEHFGKLDDEDYAATNLPKIKDYHDCGYTLGDNLIITSDNVNHRTNEIMIVNALEIIKKHITT